MDRRKWFLLTGIIVAVVVAVWGVLIASCRDGAGVAAPTPPPTETPQPTVTPALTPTPFPTPAPVVGVPAHEGGRTDCPADWYVYNDADGYFSVCFPSDASVIVALPDADLGHVLSLQLGRWTSMTIYGRPSSYFRPSDSADRCMIAPSWDDRHEEMLTVAGHEVTACAGYELLKPEDAPPLPRIMVEVPTGGDAGFVTVFLTEAEGDDFATERAAFATIVETLLLGE